jgi:hypothetical protein
MILYLVSNKLLVDLFYLGVSVHLYKQWLLQMHFQLDHSVNPRVRGH